MFPEPHLTQTATFWLDMLHEFDPHRAGPQWECSVGSLLERALPTEEHLTELVREAIIIQQFLLELVTRHGLGRASVLSELTGLLTQPVEPPAACG